MSIEQRAEAMIQPARRFNLVPVASLEFKPPSFLIRDVLEADSMALIFGDPGCGKSFVGIDIACCVASGTDWHDFGIKQGPVVYIAGEGHNGLKRRFKAWEIANGQSLDDAPLHVSTGPASLCDPESAQQVIDAVDETKASPVLVVIDTLARNFGPGDENSTRDMAEFIAAADMIRNRHNCTVLLIHHTGHGDKTRARGAMALKGALDAEYRMEKDTAGVIRFEATKMKDAQPPEPLAFHLSTVELGITDDEGREVTSAVLDKTAYTAPKRASAGAGGRNQKKAMEVLRRLLDENRLELEARDSDAIPKVMTQDWKAACDAEGLDRRRFPEVFRALKDKGEIVEIVPYVSLPV